jgi:hypothetical protein
MQKLLHRISLSVLSLIVIVCTTTGLAAAHTLKIDNGVSGLMHTQPDDDPLAGVPTELDFAFSDSENNFRLADCNCQVAVKRSNGQTIQTVGLHTRYSNSTLNSITDVEFPTTGTYSVVVTGSANDHAFSDFQLVYPVQVSKTAASQTASSATKTRDAVLIAIGVVLICALLAYPRLRRQQKD